MNLIDALRFHLRVRPFDLAVIHPGGSLNYLQLASLVSLLAARLRGHAVAPGQTAAVYVSDPMLHLGLLLALMANGTRSISAHPNHDPLPAALAVDAWLTDRELAFADPSRQLRVSAAWAQGGTEGPIDLPAGGFPDPDALCRLYTSSGTTGLPKVIGHTRAQMQAMAQRMLALEPVSQGPSLSMMALSTIGGFNTAHVALWHGATLVLAASPLATLRAINLHRVAFLRASPQQLQGLVELVHGHAARFPSLQKIEVGGASTPASLVLAARANLCPNVMGVYGSTETGMVAQAPASLMLARPEAAGYVAPDAQLRIVDDAGRPLPAGEEGLIQLRTPCMAEGYMGDAAASAAAFRQGWFVPGDVGVLQPDGLLLIRGRADEMINAGGVKLSPSLVDEFLLAQPGVRDAAAFAWRGAGQHEQVWAAVVAGPGFDEATVLAAARAKLNSRAPVRLLRVEQIPRNAMGKPMRQELSRNAAT